MSNSSTVCEIITLLLNRTIILLLLCLVRFSHFHALPISATMKMCTAEPQIGTAIHALGWVAEFWMKIMFETASRAWLLA